MNDEYFSFTVSIGTEEDCRNHFKVQRDKQGVKCKNVAANHIIGSGINGIMSVKNAIFVPLYRGKL